MKALAAIAAISLVLSGCSFGVPEEAVAVEEVVTDLELLNGKKITVTGWMGKECLGLNCRLFRSPKDASILDNWNHDKDEIDDRWNEAYDHSIELCADGWDQTWIALFMTNERVIATGELDADCKVHGGCFDGCDFKLESISRIGT